MSFRRSPSIALLSLLLLASVPSAADAEAPGPLKALVEADWLARASQGKPRLIEASSKVTEHGVTTAQDASGGCDGVKNGRWGFHVASGETDPWWQVDLGRDYPLDRVVIYNRIDGGSAARTRSIRLLVAPAGKPAAFRQVYQHDGKPFGGVKPNNPLVVKLKDKAVTARIVRLQIPGRCSFALDEVEVYATDDPARNIALRKPADQISVSRYSYPGTLPDGVMTAVPPASAKAAAVSRAHVGQVLAAARKLAKRLRPVAEPARLTPLVEKLDALDRRLAQAGAQAPRGLFLDACRVRRAIAFANPLLDMKKLLFITRHDPGGPFHMCDQYYGCNAKPGGGLFVLSDPFGPPPKLENLLANSVVQDGRLKGKRLVGGSFLSPELSFDGKTILFAYSECQAKKTYTWGPTISYHLFRCNADGSGLVQLTDGDPDDFDPCFLPNGRVAFISLRRGGYLRCGRHCPVYTLYSMESDGSDIVCLSFHETHEWHPSVNHDGMLVYSRWDYVDRDTNVAHHIWLCYP
ncbi:discoidin domain-containing protein, partial [bacterium]|nr:discoidin domain-containing protein [bacterium]